MSVSLILVPAAFAIAGLVAGAGTAGVMSQSDKDSAEQDGTQKPAGRGPVSVAVQTRMKNADLLGTALQQLGAQQVSQSGDELSAVVGDLELRMTRDADGIWTAHVAGADGREANRGEAEALIAQLDSAYAREVQQAVAARIRSRADAAGFELMSESRQDDDSVTMVLAVREQR